MFEELGGLLPLKNDYIFRRIFGDPSEHDALRSFIESIGCLTEEELQDLTLVDPQFLPDDPTGKRGIPDLVVRADSGSSLHVEMQVLRMPYFDRRILFYIASEIAKMPKSGESWGKIGRMISIVILDWNMTKDEERFHKVFHISEDSTGERFTDAVEIHVMELKRLPPDGGDKLCDWLRFIAAERREDMEMIAARAPEMNKVYLKLQRLSADENTRMILEAREREARDWATRMEESVSIGEARGISIGEARGKMQGLLEAMFSLVRDGILSAPDAAVRAGTSLEDFTAKMNEWGSVNPQGA